MPSSPTVADRLRATLPDGADFISIAAWQVLPDSYSPRRNDEPLDEWCEDLLTACKFNQFTTNETVVFYSGGLESAHMARLFGGRGVTYVYVEDINPWCRKHTMATIEPVLLVIAKAMGAHTAVVGLEYGPAHEHTGHLQGLGREFLYGLGKTLNLTVSQPLSTSEKFDLYRQAKAQGMEFHSCDNSWDWCGRCFKCFQIGSFALANGDPLPYDAEKMYTGMPLSRFMRELQDYFETGVDTIMTDNWSFRAAVAQLNRGFRPLGNQTQLTPLWHKWDMVTANRST